jgi:beta-N-acetylhexosaminidase
MDLAKKVGQLFFIGLEGDQLGLQNRHLLRTISPGGVILFNRNIESPQGVFDFCQQIRSELATPPFIGIDAEGGTVNRLHKIAAQLPPAMALGATDNEIFSFRQGQMAAKLLFLLGINLNFAPVVDLALKGPDNGIGTRSFGSYASLVIKMARSYLQGLRQQGIIGVIKHFPGMGDSPSDPHHNLPKISKSKNKLLENDIKIFDALKEDTNLIMAGHLLYPALDKKNLLPASQSPTIIGRLLREQMGYRKIVITDDLEMGAITKKYEIHQAALASLKAGTDMLLICRSPDKILSSYNYIIQAVERGEISDIRINSSVNRILSVKNQIKKQAKQFSPDEYNQVQNEIEEFSLSVAKNSISEIMRKKTSTISADDEVTFFYPKKENSNLKINLNMQSAIEKEVKPLLNNSHFAPYDPNNPQLNIGTQKKEVAIILSKNALLYPSLPFFFQQVKNEFKKVFLLSIGFPSDAKLINAHVSLALYTEIPSFLKSALLLLLGKSKTQGKLPIDKKMLASSKK